MTQREEIQRQRDALTREYGAAYERMSNILFDENPIGINLEENTDRA